MIPPIPINKESVVSSLNRPLGAFGELGESRGETLFEVFPSDTNGNTSLQTLAKNHLDAASNFLLGNYREDGVHWSLYVIRRGDDCHTWQQFSVIGRDLQVSFQPKELNVHQIATLMLETSAQPGAKQALQTLKGCCSPAIWVEAQNYALARLEALSV